MKDNFSEEKPLVRSRLSGNMIILLSLLPVLFILFSVLIVADLLPLPPLSPMFLLIVLVYLFIFYVYGFLPLRRVAVYADHIEVRYLLHKKRNYDIKLAEVNCYCLEEYDSGKLGRLKRIYLLIGRDLWLYIDEGFCGNYNQMLRVLKEKWRIPQRDGMLDLTFKEEFLVRSRGCIELEDISDEELQ